ncbi:MAG: GH92 family glycosyl hydrolase [Prolixibacteraceae bacterium]|jgi:predicted alpha-1,2-mannosidase|nr:GH92 family glycosyl hydrolase [Prolixibacteraceae bacterium]
MIKKYSFLGAIFCFLTLISCQEKQPVDYVDPFICSQGDHGHWPPAALVPFGLVEVCPDTYPGSLTADGDFAHSGYDFSDNQIRGFSNFHKGSSGGTSICDRSGLLSLVPFVNAPDSFYVSPILNIDKKTEKASPGYYSVVLPDEQIHAELTAETHVGVHKYSYPAGQIARLFLYEGNRPRSGGISFSLKDNQCIEGIQAVYGGIYFIMKFSSPVLSTKVWNGTTLTEGATLEKQPSGGIVCEFGDLKGQPLEVKIGVSLTSIEAARKNLETEYPDNLNFEQIKKDARESWSQKLSLINVEGDDENKTIFYTALYHSCFLPQIINDVDGTYPGLDRKNHQANGYTHYNNYAFWDDFRTKFPLYSIWQPQTYSDIIKSLRDMYEQAQEWGISLENNHTPHQGDGFKPSGKDGFQVFNTCRHEHMLMVMTDAYYKGLFNLDLKQLYPYIRNEAMVQMPEKYDSIGFIPARPDQTGEFCWDSWCVAQLAKEIGNDADYNYFMKRAEYWRNTWDPSIRYFRARAADGTWLDFPEDPIMNREKYTYEGSKWHWRWNVLHDVPGLIETFGGKESFVKELEYFFDNDLYTAGNQIDLQAPFLFNFAGAPWLSQKWAHKILTEPIVQKYGTHDFFPEPIFDRVYKTTPDGYLEEMDCDYGCMAAWFNMGAMGLYQVCPGKPVYQLTSPIFKKITIQLDPKLYSGKSFTIRANNLNKENYYIQSATLNGKPYNQSWINHADIVKGGELVFEMGPEPNKQWGVQ